MKNEELIYFVISSIKPYKYDIYRMLALPTGFVDRTRWREIWVHSHLQPIHNQLKGRNGLVLLKDVKSGLVYPIRYISIIDTIEIGGIYYYEFVLRDLVQFDNKIQVAIDWVLEFNKELKLYHESELFGSDNKSTKFVFASSINLDKFKNNFENDLTNWGNIIKVIGEIESIKGDEFLKIVDVSTFNDIHSKIRNGHLQLNANTHYSLNIFQIVPNPLIDPPPPHEIQISCPSEHKKVLRQKQSAVGKYDFIKFIIKTNDITKNTTSYIEIQAGNSIDSDVPAIYIPTEITRSITFFTIIKIITAVTCLYFILFPKLFNIPPELINNISLIVFIMVISDKLNWGISILSKLKF